MSNKEDDPKALPSFVVLVSGFFITIATALGVEALYRHVAQKTALEQSPYMHSPLDQQIQEEQRTKLSRYDWVDQEKSKVRIPIERAMERVVEVYGGGKAPETFVPAEKEIKKAVVQPTMPVKTVAPGSKK